MNSAAEIIQALQAAGVKPHRLRGQNFLLDQRILAEIAGLLGPGEAGAVLEIGAGLGALSQYLAKAAGQLALLEIEPAFAARLRALFADEPQVRVVQADALAFDYAAFAKAAGWPAYSVFGNLPYNITTPLLQRLLTQGGGWLSLTLLLQKEAALRICQGQGRENGPLTLLTEYYGRARLCFSVPAGAFYPRPAVESAVIRIERRQPPLPEAEAAGLFRLIRACFAQRRKTLANGAFAQLGLTRQAWLESLAAAGISSQTRAEALGLPDFQALYQRLTAVSERI